VKDLADLDLDEQALIKKSRPWGWFAAGVATIAFLGFALGYAVPLGRAHAVLVSEHETLAKKARELDQALSRASSSLAKTESERGGLEQKITKVADARQALKSNLEVAAATIERQVSSLTKAKVVQVQVGEEHLDVLIQQKALFIPNSAKVAPYLAKSLCKVLAPLGQDKALELEVTVPLLADEKEPWKTAGEQAAAIAQELSDQCQAPKERLRTGASADPGAQGRVSLRFAPKAAPALER
jgi:hypothetical protein